MYLSCFFEKHTQAVTHATITLTNERGVGRADSQADTVSLTHTFELGRACSQVDTHTMLALSLVRKSHTDRHMRNTRTYTHVAV